MILGGLLKQVENVRITEITNTIINHFRGKVMTDITWMLRLVLNALYLGLGLTAVYYLIKIYRLLVRINDKE